jgi:hypothetical protein
MSVNECSWEQHDMCVIFPCKNESSGYGLVTVIWVISCIVAVIRAIYVLVTVIRVINLPIHAKCHVPFPDVLVLCIVVTNEVLSK